MTEKPPGPGMILTALFWGAVCGFIGFVGGFFGPLLLHPEANQGPLLAILTGPLGALIGAAYGLIRRLQER